MKFGKVLRSTVEARMPQWSDFVIAYKPLKRAIKALTQQRQMQLQPQPSPSQQQQLGQQQGLQLQGQGQGQQELAQLQWTQRRSSELEQGQQGGQHGWSLAAASSSFTALLDSEVDKVNNFYSDRIEEAVIIVHALRQHIQQMGQEVGQRMACQKSLVSFHFNLLMLQNYVALNFTGLVKILKKFDKRFDASLRADYIAAIVELPFYRCAALGQLVEDTEKLFNSLDAAPSPLEVEKPPLTGT